MRREVGQPPGDGVANFCAPLKAGSKPKARETGQMDATPKLVTGVDVSDRYSTFCTLNAAGEIEEEGRVRTAPEAFRTHFQKLPGES
jgi:hypothetical protein